MLVTPASADESNPSPRPRTRQPRAKADAAPQVEPSATQASTPVSGISEIVALFERRSAVLRFPNVDAESLRAQVERVDRLRVEAAEALAQWEAARVASEQSERELAEMSRRAVAYARVFATDDPTLEAELDVILRTEPQGAKRKKREVSADGAAPEPARTRRPRTPREGNEADAKPAQEAARDAASN